VSGHGGCLGTLHATYPRDTLTRLETMCMMSDVSMPLSAIRMQVGSGIDVIVQVDRLPDGSRKITHITEVVQFDVDAGKYELRDLFTRSFRPANGALSAGSELRPTGAMPTFRKRLLDHGVDLPASLLAAIEREGGRDDRH
jgi:pilus assembly protein CpaF